ncbi:kinase-like domain-containing protein [Rhizophagus irregularis DAOM 181602=DAOM 197198]|nr:kinase-like domain-containing protein [Rhizophagus irregularis DAOM 181602=DAOM 197198]
MSNDNKYEIQMESEFNKLNISDRNPNINHENCYKPNDGKLWCKECVPHCIVEGWTSGNNDIDEFIKDTIYNAKLKYCDDVYSAIWIDNKVKYIRQNDGSWKKGESAKPIKVALKKLNDSQNISVEYLNEIKTLWNIYFNETTYLKFYGITKDIKTKEFMMIIQLANKGSLRCILSKLSSGKPPFYNRKHDISLSLEICNGVRPEFGKGTPEIYKKLAYRCMSAVPNQRPTADELYDALKFWYHPSGEDERDKFGYKGKKIKAIFNEADNEILNISTSYEKNPDAIYTSRVFTFSNLPKPVNSPIVTSYLNDDDEENKDCQDSKLFDLEVPN